MSDCMLETYRSLFLIMLLTVSIQPGKAMQQPYYAFDNRGGITQKWCIRSIQQTADGMIWLGTENGLYSYDGYHLINRSANETPVGKLASGCLNCLLVDEDRLLIGSNEGLLSFCLKTFKFSLLPYARDEMVKDIVKAGSSIWVATGTAIYRDGRKLTPSPDNIISMYADEAFLYIGTVNAVHRFSIKSGQSEKLTEGMPYASCFAIDQQDSLLWIGTSSNVTVWDKKAMKHVFSIPMPVAKSLCKDKAGNMLVGTDYGLYVVDQHRRMNALFHDARRENSLAGDAVWSLFSDRDNTVWIGTNSGLSVIPGNGLMTTYPLPSITGDGIGNQFFCVYSDSKGRQWLGGANGLLCIEQLGKENQTYRWYRMNDARYALPHNRVRGILEDRDGTLLICGDMGLLQYNEVSQQFQRLAIKEDPYNWVYDIRESNNGDFIITTFTATYSATLDKAAHTVTVKKTLQREDLSGKSNKEKALLEKYGVAENYLSAHHDTVNETLLLGGIDRFSVLNTKTFDETRKNRTLTITDIRINGERYMERKSLLQGKVMLMPEDRLVEVLFSDFNYSGERTQHYRYRIDDGEWVPVHSENNSVMLTNLKPGKHTLSLGFSDALEEAILCKLTVIAPWYASTLAKGFYLLLFLCLIYGAFYTIQQRRRIQQERVEHQQLLLQIKQKEKALLSDNEYLAAQLRLQLLAKAGEDGTLSEDEKFLLKITKIIEETMSDTELTVNTLSERSGVSSKQLYRKIKAMTGMTTVAYIRDQRLKKAASLLAKGTFTVSEVMYMVGFSNPSYFTRCFTDEYNTPPSEYRG